MRTNLLDRCYPEPTLPGIERFGGGPKGLLTRGLLEVGSKAPDRRRGQVEPEDPSNRCRTVFKQLAPGSYGE
jgi:hypothetical protein